MVGEVAPDPGLSCQLDKGICWGEGIDRGQWDSVPVSLGTGLSVVKVERGESLVWECPLGSDRIATERNGAITS